MTSCFRRVCYVYSDRHKVILKFRHTPSTRHFGLNVKIYTIRMRRSTHFFKLLTFSSLVCAFFSIVSIRDFVL